MGNETRKRKNYLKMAKNILKEAIADAKAVREVALANAKAALEEAFTPKLQSMLSEELYEDGELDLEEVQSYDINQSTEHDGGEDYATISTMENANLDEVVDLESILNELELEEGDDKDEDDDKEELEEMEVIYNAETANRAHYTADHVHEGCTNCDD